ncbi:hypothetical protein BG262_04775 [Floricoccus penangensis]|uniref:Uncharacterized protein n=1 Tax=Floricoccus penangensis TaxID=1859475 RepID=A0A9Q5JG98_9LACT|nr:hypothetical protein [Floricoccus penangensis]OFI46332.1 hypothetical protein BG262_04775 [Floricoccus penangensis]
MKNKKKAVYLLVLLIILNMIMFLLMIHKSNRREVLIENEFEIEKVVPLGDSNRFIEIVRDNKNKVEYIVDGENWIRRDK